MNASVAFTPFATRTRRGSSKSDGLAMSSSAPSLYWPASTSETSSSGSSMTSSDFSRCSARSARNDSLPNTSTTGAGDTCSQPILGMLAAMRSAYGPPPTRSRRTARAGS